MEKVRIGISRCLLGDPVRYDGGHKKDSYLVHTLGTYFDYVPVCPEVECGMGVPREPLRLVGDPVSPRMKTTRSNVDCTAQMQSWSNKRVRELGKENLCGFIFKSRSPSSGMERVKVYNEKTGIPATIGKGIFARTFMDHFPLHPAEDEGRLNDPGLRENFIERIFVYDRWRTLISGSPRTADLIHFHTRHKLLILSHSTDIYRALGKITATVRKSEFQKALDDYQALLMKAMKLKATVKKQTNVLQHMMGYFKNILSSDEKKEVLEVIDQYHDEQVPLIVPLTLIKHFVRKYDQPYLKEQIYLDPHPIELKLRNHI